MNAALEFVAQVWPGHPEATRELELIVGAL